MHPEVELLDRKSAVATDDTEPADHTRTGPARRIWRGKIHPALHVDGAGVILGRVTELGAALQDRVNVKDEAMAQGRPLPMSRDGARILVTLLHALVQRGSRHGLAALCCRPIGRYPRPPPPHPYPIPTSTPPHRPPKRRECGCRDGCTRSRT